MVMVVMMVMMVMMVMVVMMDNNESMTLMMVVTLALHLSADRSHQSRTRRSRMSPPSCFSSFFSNHILPFQLRIFREDKGVKFLIQTLLVLLYL